MKNILFTIFILVVGFQVSSQSPNAFQYQAILRNAEGLPWVNQAVSLRISILSDTIQNIIEYIEIQYVMTDNTGRINLQIGKGNSQTGAISEINWGVGDHFIRIEFDPNGGSNFVMAGQSQLLSVPYALFAGDGGTEYFSGEGIIISDNVISNSGDLSNTNELQTISKSGNVISLNQGGGSVSDSDNQTLTISALGTVRQIQISGGNTVNIDVSDSDNNPNNELQIISIAGDTIFLSNGGFVKLPVPSNAIVPPGGCIQSLNPEPPAGYSYSGNSFFAGDQWKQMPSMSYARFGAVVVAAGSKVYVIGGWDGVGSVSNIVEEYDINSGIWTRKANMNTAVVYAAGAVVGNLIYVMGGYTGSTITNRNQVYNITTNSWSLANNLTQARSGCGAAVINGKIYLIGGFYNNAALNTNQMFDPGNNTWTDKTAMNSARTDFATVVLNDGIYAIGGWNQDALNVNEYYSPSTNSWTTLYPLPDYRAGCSGSAVNSRIYLMGGGDAYSYNTATLEYYPATNEWKETASLPSPRSYLGAATVGEQIYVAGGNFGQALKTMFEYKPAKQQYYIHCSE